MGSAVRVILRNERYRGVVHSNQSEWRKDPDTGKRQRVERPRTEWITRTDDSLRIVSDELWQRAHVRLLQSPDQTLGRVVPLPRESASTRPRNSHHSGPEPRVR
jgi:hypothetical protein